MKNRFDKTLPKKLPKLFDPQHRGQPESNDIEEPQGSFDSGSENAAESQDGPMQEAVREPVSEPVREAAPVETRAPIAPPSPPPERPRYSQQQEIRSSVRISTSAPRAEKPATSQEPLPFALEALPFEGLPLGEKREVILKMTKELGGVFSKFFGQKSQQESELRTLEQDIFTLKNKNQQLREEYQKHSTQFGLMDELTVEKNFLVEEKKGVEMRIQDQKSSINKQKQAIEEIERKIKLGLKEREAKLQKIPERKREIESQEIKLGELTRHLAQVTAERQEAHEKLSSLKKEQDKVLKVADELEEVRKAILS